ncbi:hypothetical protein RJ641_035257 [Dillenia turbinata]|uniref:Uncharacterized protein n=1 Tax=Dillenia turbinata TaxID=194707 RepID=A0AAN8ZER8_9MAGN
MLGFLPLRFSSSTWFAASQSGLQSVRRELIMLSLPAAAGQALEPLTQLLETAFICRLVAVELASAGVSRSIFNNISKLFNIPLLTEEIAKSLVIDSITGDELLFQEERTSSKPLGGMAERKQLASVSTALFLAFGIGMAEALALFLGSEFFLNLMGIPLDSAMRVPPQQFLCLRALGAPAFVVSLALEGIFHGFKDTKTTVLSLGKSPINCCKFYAGLGNFSAVIFFPILINYFHHGVTGASISAVITQYLNKRAVPLPPNLGALQCGGHLKSGENDQQLIALEASKLHLNLHLI